MSPRTAAYRLIAAIAAIAAGPFVTPTHSRRGFLQPAGYLPQWGRSRRGSKSPKGTQREKLYYGGWSDGRYYHHHAALPFKPMSVCSRLFSAR